MVKKTLGYVELEWTCPRCGSKNPGPQKSCSGCGAPQPDDVEFEQAAEEELITDEEEIERAKAGPDVHCAFCGARNPAGAKTCSQCSADLTEATARVSGQVVGAHRREAAPDVACPSCGAMNPAAALKCSQCGASLARPEPKPEPRTPPGRAAAPQRGGCGRVAIIAGVVLIALIALGVFLTRPSSDRVATVEDVSWTRVIPIMGLVPVTYEDWQDEIPPEAVLGDCRQEPHHVQDNPAPNSKEICGTPYTVDTGSGHGEVVQDCQYEVYAEWCQYTTQELRVIDQVVQTGHDLNPRWPVTQLAVDQQQGQGEETYEIVFDTDGGTYTYTTSDPAEFARFQDGSRWLLKVNKLGGIVSVEPAE